MEIFKHHFLLFYYFLLLQMHKLYSTFIYINNGIYNFVRIYEMEHERECRENAETNHILPTEKRWHP